jgi:hypothetical protein
MTKKVCYSGLFVPSDADFLKKKNIVLGLEDSELITEMASKHCLKSYT